MTVLGETRAIAGGSSSPVMAPDSGAHPPSTPPLRFAPEGLLCDHCPSLLAMEISPAGRYRELGVVDSRLGDGFVYKDCLAVVARRIARGCVVAAPLFLGLALTPASWSGVRAGPFEDGKAAIERSDQR